MKGNFLMVHESTRFGAAALGKSPRATMFDRNTMLKTLKRKIALVAVAAHEPGARLSQTLGLV